MYLFEGTTYWSAMSIPVPIRKWLIKRYQKQREIERPNKKPSMDEPLNQGQRQKVKNESRQVQSDPSKMADFMKSVRNK